MRTIRWCKTHKRALRVCEFWKREEPLGYCREVDAIVIDPDNPEDVAEFLQSLPGWKRQPMPEQLRFEAGYPDQERWVGPWEKA